jgi:putative transcriptional regulator
MLPWRTPAPPRTVDVAAIRAASGYGQETFAAICGISLRTLQGWECGRRKPGRTARALLMVIAHNPAAYSEAAQAANRA